MTSSNTRRYTQIGLDRLVRLKWLEVTASLVLAGNDISMVKTVLKEQLSKSFHSDADTIRGSLEKTITILVRIWANVPRELRSLHHEAINLLAFLPQEDHVAVHWGMTMAVYPFWGAVAMQVGRLLRLQGTAGASQVQRRVREQYGERETVTRRVRYVLRSFVDWGALKETPNKGVYSQGDSFSIDDPQLVAWITEASLLAHPNGSAAMKSLLESPSNFPFRLAHISAEHLASLSPRLEILRHGLDDDLVMLHDQGGVR